MQTAITIPLREGPEKLSVCSKLTYLTTVRQEPRCILGLQFLEPRPKAQRIIEEFFVLKLREYYVAEEPDILPATV